MSAATYLECRSEVERSIENGCKDLVKVLQDSAHKFKKIPYKNGFRKPVVAIVGEIFMRDNPYCSSYLVDRLEKLGAETLMAPFGEWIKYSTYRYIRDSKWKKDTKNLIKSKFQHVLQNHFEERLVKAVAEIFPIEEELDLKEILKRSNRYIHQDYDGDPPMAMGSASILSEKCISGIVNILPFTCMPGTLNTAVSDVFRKDNGGIPWENFAYDGQEDSSIDTRLQAFMHQVNEYASRKKSEMLPVW